MIRLEGVEGNRRWSSTSAFHVSACMFHVPVWHDPANWCRGAPSAPTARTVMQRRAHGRAPLQTPILSLPIASTLKRFSAIRMRRLNKRNRYAPLAEIQAKISVNSVCLFSTLISTRLISFFWTHRYPCGISGFSWIFSMTTWTKHECSGSDRHLRSIN